MKKNVLIIGAGGVAQVVAHKCAQNSDVLGDIHIASRTIEKGRRIVESIHEKKSLKADVRLEAHTLDAMDPGSDQGAHYQNRVPDRDQCRFCLRQHVSAGAPASTPVRPIWTRRSTRIPARSAKCRRGTETMSGNGRQSARRRASRLFSALVLIQALSTPMRGSRRMSISTRSPQSISSDINAGSHGRYFATNFDPEINFREFTGQVYSWQNGAWQTNRMFEVGQEFDLPVVGKQKAYLTGHDEVHSLSKHMDGADVRFWMGFGDHYINVFTVLNKLGLLSEQPVKTAEGLEVVPLKVVKAVLPDPTSLAPDYAGKTCIGDFVKGIKDGMECEVFIYNVADHKEAFEEVGSQGISYTAGVPAVAAAMLVATGEWDIGRMANVEELRPRPLLELLNGMGLPTRIRDINGDHPFGIALKGAWSVGFSRLKTTGQRPVVKQDIAGRLQVSVPD